MTDKEGLFMNRNIDKTNKINNKVLLLLVDILLIQIASFLSIYIRFDFEFSTIPRYFIEGIVSENLSLVRLIILLLTKSRTK